MSAAPPRSAAPPSLVADVLIAGAGMSGLATALALGRGGLSVLCVDTRAAPAFDDPRPIALAESSRRILTTLGVWAELGRATTAIREIHVSERGALPKVRLRAADSGVAAFGHVVRAGLVTQALHRALEAEPGVQRLQGATLASSQARADLRHATLRGAAGSQQVSAALLIGADGGGSGLRDASGIAVRRRDYGQSAITATVRGTRGHGGRAFERFTRSGPLAALPMAGDRMALVWCMDAARAEALVGATERDFVVALERAFGGYLGALHETGTRACFPLAMVRAAGLTGDRAVLVGNAANQLHPVAGQGFNLGLRDAAVLAEQLVTAAREGRDLGEPVLLAHYAALRAGDHRRVCTATDLLVRAFSNGLPLLGLARRAGLLGLALTPPLKRGFARLAMGLGGAQSRLARGLAS